METISIFPELIVENIDAKSNIKLNKNIFGLISIEIFVNNRKMIFIIDTGARKSWINDRLVEQAKLKILKNKNQKVSGIHGKQIKTVKIIKEYKLSLKDSLITFNKIETGFTGLLNNYNFDGVFGSDVI